MFCLGTDSELQSVCCATDYYNEIKFVACYTYVRTNVNN